MMRVRWCRPCRRTASMKRWNSGRSKQNCVWMNCAPASIFISRLATRSSYGGTKGLAGAPRKRGVGRVVGLAPGVELPGVAHPAGDAQQADRIEVEDGLGLRVVALAHVVARQSKDGAY